VPDEPFIDYYQLLQVSPNAEAETIQRVYRTLVKRQHPENPDASDAQQFVRLGRAYEILSSREKRLAYDRVYQQNAKQPLAVFELKEFAPGIEGEPNRRMGVLCLLYMQRRSNPESAGLSILDLENISGLPREHLLFTLWGLKELELIVQDETTDFAIAGPGAAYLEKNLPSNEILHRFMKSAEMGELDRGEAPLADHKTA
jgi:curved DNA-binding protein CbpA